MSFSAIFFYRDAISSRAKLAPFKFLRSQTSSTTLPYDPDESTVFPPGNPSSLSLFLSFSFFRETKYCRIVTPRSRKDDTYITIGCFRLESERQRERRERKSLFFSANRAFLGRVTFLGVPRVSPPIPSNISGRLAQNAVPAAIRFTEAHKHDRKNRGAFIGAFYTKYTSVGSPHIRISRAPVVIITTAFIRVRNFCYRRRIRGRRDLNN